MAGASPTLMTALVIHYNNGDVIYETLDSVFMQDYPRIELVVSDDCSPSFPREAIERYIEQHKRSNIERVVVRQNERNLGTVAHLECVREQTEGEIELLIAADDCWHDEVVFSDFARLFDELGPDAEFITSQIEMCDETLETVESLFVAPSVQQMLRIGDMHSLLDLEAKTCALAGPGSAFRRSYFHKVGKLSEHYTIVEDWSAHVRWLRMGQRIYYLDRVTLKHRHGGISHSAAIDWPAHYMAYRRDIERMFRVEVEPYEHLFSPSAFVESRRVHERALALRCSLEHRAAVLLLAEDCDHAEKALDSIMSQNCVNYEIIIGCYRDLADWLIATTNLRFIGSPSIRRIRIVLLGERDMKDWRVRLQAEAHSDICIAIGPDETFTDSSSLLELVAQEVEGVSLYQDETPLIRPITVAGKKQSSLHPAKTDRGAKKSLSDFMRVSKIKEDVLYAAFAVSGICLLEICKPPFGIVYSVLLGIALAATLVILCARVGLFLFKRCNDASR